LHTKSEKLKKRLAELGPLHPGSISEQYNVCAAGLPMQRSQEAAPARAVLSAELTWRGKSSTRFVRPEGLPEMRQKVANYKRLRELVNEWVELAIELEKAERAAAKQGHGD